MGKNESAPSSSVFDRPAATRAAAYRRADRRMNKYVSTRQCARVGNMYRSCIFPVNKRVNTAACHGDTARGHTTFENAISSLENDSNKGHLYVPKADANNP